ncbi:MAG: UbiD family decarboxylase, partial [Planctomycetota bacterium]
RVSKSPAPNMPSDSARETDPRFHHLGGTALLFENVEGSSFPLLINAFGSYRRMEMALGVQGELLGADDGWSDRGFAAVADKIASLVKPEPPRSLGEAIEKAKEFAPLLRIPPKRGSRGLCQEIVYAGDAVDLTTLPIIRCWPHDGDFEAVGYPAGVNDNIPGIEADNADIRGRYITLAGIHTIHPDDEHSDKPTSHNIGMYRVQLLGRHRVAMHWHMHHDGASHWRAWKKRGKPMPVAIALGGESALPYAATAPLPPGISELLMAGFLNRGGIKMCRGKTVPIWVPANAEIVIEGFVRTDAGFIGYDPRTGEPLGEGAVFEGPFGDHTGFYSMPDRYPIVEVSALTHRRDAIYPTTIVGLPPQEDYYLGKATERVFFPLLKTLIHDIEDYDLPLFGAFHNAAFVQIDKQYPLQGRRVMHAIWGAGQMAWTKSIFIVDEDVDCHDLAQVMDAVSRRCDPLRDIELVRGPLDILDHASPRLGAGTKIGFDATRKWPGDEIVGDDQAELPEWTPPDDEQREVFLRHVRAVDHVKSAEQPELCGRGWLFVGVESGISLRDVRTLVHRVDQACDHHPGHARFVVLLGEHVNIENPDEALFHWCANFSPDRDLYRGQGSSGSVVIFDATPKTPCTAAERAPGGEGDPGHAGLVTPMHAQPARPWPPVLEMDEATKRKVDERWGEYGLP